MSNAQDDSDPRGLIRESYRIEGIGMNECRAIFLDWAISIPEDQGIVRHIEALLTRYAADHADHPMTKVLKEGRATPPEPRRRGGRRGRLKT